MKRNGFSILEVLIALSMLTLGTLLIASLGQQIQNLANRAKQTGVAIDYKSMAIGIEGNVPAWLDKMRTRAKFYESCLPSKNGSIGKITCPQTAAKLSDLADNVILKEGVLSDSKLEGITTGFHFVAAPIVNAQGQDVAGDINDPVYLNLDGSPCALPNPRFHCPTQSIGLFGRTNKDVDGPAGYSRFIFMLMGNPNYLPPGGHAVAPVAPQFAKVDVPDPNVGEARCKKGELFLGMKTSGLPFCVARNSSCPSGVPVDVDANGKTVCSPIPVCAANEKVVLGENNKLTCSRNSPCTADQTHVGTYFGSGGEICLAANACAEGQVMVGGKDAASPSRCVDWPNNCDDQNRAVFDGAKFTCQSNSIAKSCVSVALPHGVVVGVKENGELDCRDIASITGTDGKAGPDGKYGSDGETPLDIPAADGADGKDVENGTSKFIANRCPTTPVFQFVVGVNEDGSLICEPMPVPPTVVPVVPKAIWFVSNVQISGRHLTGSCETTCQALGKIATGACRSAENSTLPLETFPLGEPGAWDGKTYRFKSARGPGVGQVYAQQWCYKPRQKHDYDFSDIIEACECKAKP
jgi:hypothetical protein